MYSGVGDPFLNQEVRYHCPVFGILKYMKPKTKTFTRHIYSYKKGNFNLLREKATSVDGNSLQDDNIDVYASNIESKITSLARECIPNKNIKVRPNEPPWLTTFLKRKIRQQNRAYRKAKRTRIDNHWLKFRMLRNEVIDLIRT